MAVVRISWSEPGPRSTIRPRTKTDTGIHRDKRNKTILGEWIVPEQPSVSVSPGPRPNGSVPGPSSPALATPEIGILSPPPWLEPITERRGGQRSGNSHRPRSIKARARSVGPPEELG